MTTPTPIVKPKPTTEQIKQALAAVPDTRSTKDDDRDWTKILLRIGLVLLALLIAGVVWLMFRGQTAEDQRANLLQLIDTECGPGGALVDRPLCIATAPQRASDTAAAADDAGLDAAKVIELVRAELATRPAGTVTTSDVDAAVRRILAENPTLVQGQQPSDAQVQAAAAAVIAASPERFRGPAGESPACLQEPGECRGTDGTPPVRITQQYADGSSTVCIRDDGSPDTAPSYTCPPPAGAPAGPSEPSTPGRDEPTAPAEPPPAEQPPAGEPQPPAQPTVPPDPGFLGP